MSHFAHITNGIVDNVIVIDAETLALGHWGDPSEWVQTSYNTHGGVNTRTGVQIGKNYAGIGMHYDGVGFHAPKPYTSWALNAETYQYEAPVAMPAEGGAHVWDEASLSWLAVEVEQA